VPSKPDELVCTATFRAGQGTDLRTGELLPALVVSARVGYAIALTKELGTAMLAEHYNAKDLAALGSGVGLDGRPLPAKAYMAERRLGWACPSLPGVYLPDRARRTIEEQVVRRLRQLAWTDKVVTGLVSTWPEVPNKRSPEEWGALWAAVPPGTDKATVRNRTRRVASYLGQYAGLPTRICELEAEASFGPVLALAPSFEQGPVVVGGHQHRPTSHRPGPEHLEGSHPAGGGRQGESGPALGRPGPQARQGFRAPGGPRF
jgi:hypothetical protein